MSTGENESKEEEMDSDAPSGKKAKIVAGEVIRSWKSSTRGIHLASYTVHTRHGNP